MSRPLTRARRLLGVAAALCLTFSAVAGVATSAQAAKPTPTAKPLATATAVVTDDTAQVSVSVSRAPNQIRSATCTLDGALVACGSPTAQGKKSASYAVSLTGLSVGEHTFTITIRLTDGGSATASAEFDVVGAPATPQAVCDATGGTFAEGYWGWTCSPVPPEESGGIDALIEVCQGGVLFGADMLICNRSEGDSLMIGYVTCINITEQSGFSLSGDTWTCRTDNPDAGGSAEYIEATCVSEGASFAREVDPSNAAFTLLSCTKSA